MPKASSAGNLKYPQGVYRCEAWLFQAGWGVQMGAGGFSRVGGCFLTIVMIVLMSCVGMVDAAGASKKPTNPPPAIPNGVYGNIYAWNADPSEEEWRQTPFDALVTLSPYENIAYPDPRWVCPEAWEYTVGSYFTIEMPIGFDDGTKFAIRIWFDAKIYSTPSWYDEVYSGHMVYETVMRLYNDYPIQDVELQTNVVSSVGRLPISAAMFDAEAASCCSTVLSWSVGAGVTRTFSTALTVGGTLTYGAVTAGIEGTIVHDTEFTSSEVIGQGPTTFAGGAMIGHEYVKKWTVPVIWPEEQVIQYLDFSNPLSQTMGNKPYPDPQIFDEQTAKAALISGNSFIGAWIPRSDWSTASFPFSLRFFEKHSVESESWSVAIKLQAYVGVPFASLGGSFKAQWSWNTWDESYTRTEAKLLYDPGPEYAGILVWMPNTLVDEFGATIPNPHNIMYVYLCTTSPY